MAIDLNAILDKIHARAKVDDARTVQARFETLRSVVLSIGKTNIGDLSSGLLDQGKSLSINDVLLYIQGAILNARGNFIEDDADARLEAAINKALQGLI